MSDLEKGAVSLNNAAECFGYILAFLAYWSDGEWNKAEADIFYKAVAQTLAGLELDTDGDGDVDEDDFKASIDSINASFTNCTFDESAYHVKNICSKYFGEWSEDNRNVILNRCVELVKADGELTDVEKNNVNFVASCLGLEKPF